MLTEAELQEIEERCTEYSKIVSEANIMSSMDVLYVSDVSALLAELKLYKRALWEVFRDIDANCRATDGEVSEHVTYWLERVQKELSNDS